MMRLLFVWQNLDCGGGEVALVNLLEQLINSYEIDILCYESINKLNIPKNVNVYFANKPTQNVFSKIYNKVKFMLKWLKMAKSYDIQIINEVPFMVIIGWIISIFSNKKYWVWAHSCRNEMGSGFGRLLTLIHRYSLLKANHIICVSNYATNSMYEYVKIKLTNIIVISNIIKIILPNDKDIPQLEQNVVKLCAVGRLTSEKNFSLLIAALALVVTKTQERIHLYICGDGDEFDLLISKIKKLNLEKYVTLTGHVRNVLGYINQCDIFISSSNSESLSMVVCEALYCNKAVIATRTGAAEVLENGKYGLVVEKENILQLVDAIVLFINDKDMREQYAKKSRVALDKFDQALIIKQWQKVIEMYA